MAVRRWCLVGVAVVAAAASTQVDAGTRLLDGAPVDGIASAVRLTPTTPDPSMDRTVVSTEPGDPVPSPGIVRVAEAVAYGPHERQRLDLYEPRTDRDGTLLIWVHGGSWWAGARTDLTSATPFDSPALVDLAGRLGWLVASIDYRLSGEATWPAPVHDVATAVAWARENASSLGVDPGRIVLAGYSAGGQLAAALAYGWESTDIAGELAGGAARPAAVVSFAAPIDAAGWAASGAADAPAALAALLGCPVPGDHRSCTGAQLAAVDLTRYASAGDPPVLLVHGDADQVVPIGSQEAAVEQLQAVPGQSTWWHVVVSDVSQPDRGHQVDATLDVDVLDDFVRSSGLDG